MISLHKYSFLDFGCGDGGSMNWARRFFKVTGDGLGIDISPQKVERARERGFDAEIFDIERLPDDSLVRFVTMIHFLEHLEGFGQAERFVDKACRIASEFVAIRQPFFDADGLLLENGLKLHWSDWTGHTFPMSSLQMFRICRAISQKGLMQHFSIGFFKRVSNSHDPSIIPIDAPKDQTVHDLEAYTTKRSNSPVCFSFPVYRELVCVIAKDRKICENFEERIPMENVVYRR